MIRKIKIFLANWLAPYLKMIFLDEIYRISMEQNTELLGQVRDLLQEAQENGLDIYTEINPMLMTPFVIGLGYTEQPEDKPKKENPFKLVEDEEE